MNHTNLWADHFSTAASLAIADQETFLTGRADLDKRGIERFLVAPGRISGLVAARNTGAELHTSITLPLLASDQAAGPASPTPHGRNHEPDDAALSDWMTDPDPVRGLNLLPDPAHLRFACTCPAASPCRHAAALAHAFIDRLRTHPGDLAVLRGLRQPALPAQDIPAADRSADTSTKTRLSAHHAWTWYRECTDLPPIPDYSPPQSNEPPSPATWAPPPPPAPTSEHLNALVNDAAAQAKNFLHSGTPLECAWEADTIRLASRIPHIRISDIADRLDLDIAELRDRITAARTPG
ncbi:hypothetical protein ACFCWY_36200 [Streptomyces sp. NPDC056362]|uniref:hypothetical protein n=1 Tax=unclassified Streptomyces TaxID=2593676 RepID=UPI0035E1E191